MRRPAQKQSQLAAHLGKWLADAGLDVAMLDAGAPHPVRPRRALWA